MLSGILQLLIQRFFVLSRAVYFFHHTILSHSSTASIHFSSLQLEIHVEKAVHLPGKGKYEGEMLYFSERYQLALLKIEVESTIKVEPPCEGSRPWYNDKVLTLARDKEMSLKVHPGKIMWQEENYLLFVNCTICPVIIISVCSFHVFLFHCLLTLVFIWCSMA